jgi:hypothetical protein
VTGTVVVHRGDGTTYTRRAPANGLDRGEHGTRAAYDAGCRCGDCVDARRAQWRVSRAVRVVEATGQVRWLVPIGRTARHLVQLLDDGWALEDVAVKAECSVSSLQRILTAYRRRPPRTWNTIERSVLAIPATDRRVTGARPRVREA